MASKLVYLTEVTLVYILKIVNVKNSPLASDCTLINCSTAGIRVTTSIIGQTRVTHAVWIFRISSISKKIKMKNFEE